MKVALVNNGTLEPQKLYKLLKDHEVTEFPLGSADDVLKGTFDLIVLSGSSQFPIAFNLDRLSNELRLITESTAPLLGICYGCELISVAFGGTLRDMEKKEKGIYTVTPIVSDELFVSSDPFEVYDAHRWVLDEIPADIEVLATSPVGPEIIRHRTRPIYGFQFHPEKMTDETYGDEMFRALIARLRLSTEGLS